jgi:hypothetical protein
VITPKTFAALGSVWHVAVPSLEQFTRWVNATERPYTFGVPRTGDTARSALIAETAFQMATAGLADSTSEASARSLLERLPGPPQGGPLSAEELAQSRRLARNLTYIVPMDGKTLPTAHPVFPGCGVVGSAVGDLLRGHELIEVKTVERGFRGLDFRQSLTYAALAYAAGQEIGRITLVNPRRALWFTSSSSTLARDLGAVSWIDLMQNLVNAMTDVNPSQ